MGNDFLYMKRGRCAAPGSEGSEGGGGGWRRNFYKKGARLTPQVGADYVGGLCRRGATALRAEGGGIALGHTFGVRVDGASPRGLWPPDGGGLYSLRSGGDSGWRRNF